MGELDVLDWRRAVHALYAEVRRAPTPEAGWNLWRRGRDRLFRTHAASPIAPCDRAAHRGVPVFDYDPGYRFLVGIQPVAGALAEEADLGPDGLIRLRPLFRTVGLAARLGAELTAYWIDAYGGDLFVPFLDAGADRYSYQSGRYLIDTVKGADLGDEGGRFDFNFAYHPSCYYDPRWICPLSPATNYLPEIVVAGECLAAANAVAAG